MKAYEFPAKVTSEGKLEIPDELLESLATNQLVRVIVLVSEQFDQEQDDEDLGFSEESFRESLRQAIAGETLPISQLWDGIELLSK